MKNFKLATHKKVDFAGLSMEQLVAIIEPWELAVLLLIEPETDATDILLDNMLYDFLEGEQYEYACVIRDEIKRRNPLI